MSIFPQGSSAGLNECQMTPKTGLLEQLRRKLFPVPWRKELPGEETRTYLTTSNTVHLDWKDRLRVLVCGRVHTEIVTFTDVEVKQASSVCTREWVA
jgi:hypothetical protein